MRGVGGGGGGGVLPNEADPFAKKRLGTYSGNVIDRRYVYWLLLFVFYWGGGGGGGGLGDGGGGGGLGDGGEQTWNPNELIHLPRKDWEPILGM